MNMRIRNLLVLALTLVMTGGLAVAQEDKEKGASVLEDEMIAANKVMKTLRTQIADPSKNASSLQMIEQMQKHFLAAKGMEPLRAKKVSESERPKFLTEYRKAMVMLMGEMLKMEQAILDGKNDEAEKVFKGLTKIKTDAHEKFQEE
jgi:soluble cytochrome b562